MQYGDLKTSYGRSGARFIVVPDGVMKIASTDVDRVTAQGAFCGLLQGVACIPQIVARGTGWYVMERLRARPSSGTPSFMSCLREVEALWDAPERIMLPVYGLSDWRTYVLAYARQRLHEMYYHESTCAQTLAAAFSVGHFAPAMTHGDPTEDNLMYRWTPAGSSQPVFVDPLPPAMYLPMLRALDMGKMLQSAVGWHALEYGRAGEWALDAVEDAFRLRYAPSESVAAWAFCLYHLIRAARYTRHLPHLIDLIKKVEIIVQEKTRVTCNVA